MKKNKKILVAVAWPYVNGDLHLGHLAGYLLPADIFARYQRLRGHDVLMVSGSDCHGTPITVEADKQKVEPKAIVDKYHKQDMDLFKQYGISYNLYTKTTTENHKRVVHEVFLDLLKNGFIVKGSMKQYYSEQDKQFLPDRYVEGTCPYCHAPKQRSDQCENCGRWLGDGELINPTSKLTGATVALKDTEHYFLDFPKLNAELKKYVETRKGIWRDWVWAEANGWLNEGLQKRAITRDMDWSIELPIEEIKKLPADKQLNDFTGKRIYVWFEAVIGYLSAPQEWMEIDKQNSEVIFKKDKGQSNNWKDWWVKNDEFTQEQYYFMGQDNLVFHTLMWPGELMGAQKNYVIPHNVVVNKFMNYEGQKFSKSRGWTIDSKIMADKYGVDLVRYYIASNLPENKEANFTWEGFVDAINNELVANFGNFVNRTLVFISAKLGGKVSSKKPINKELKTDIDFAYKQVAESIESTNFVAALNTIMELSSKGNKYFDSKKPWELIKTDPSKANEVLVELLNLIYHLGMLIKPFLPDIAMKIFKMLAMELPEEQVGIDKWLSVEEYNDFNLDSSVSVLFQKLDRETVLTNKDS